MTETKVLTAERMEEIGRLSLDAQYGLVARHHVVELLAALEAAQAEQAKAEKERDEARSRLAEVDSALAPTRAPRHVDAPAPTLAKEVVELIRRVETAERSSVRDAARVAELEGIRPELPPRPPNGFSLPRYGLRWNGPETPLSVPMADGYWTPYHLAVGKVAELEANLATARAQAFLDAAEEVSIYASELVGNGQVAAKIDGLEAARDIERNIRILAATSPEQAPAPPRTADVGAAPAASTGTAARVTEADFERVAELSAQTAQAMRENAALRRELGLDAARTPPAAHPRTLTPGQLLDADPLLLDLTVRASNGIQTAGIKTVRDLVGMTRSGAAGLKNMGAKGADDVAAVLAGFGLAFRVGPSALAHLGAVASEEARKLARAGDPLCARVTCATCTHWRSAGADVGECMGSEGSAIAYGTDSCDEHEPVAPSEVKP